jgi:hypothetical protein
MNSVTYSILDNIILLSSDDKENPLLPHLDSDGSVMASWDLPFTIATGVSARVFNKTVTLVFSGKKGHWQKCKLPADAVIALAEAILAIRSKTEIITPSTILNIDQAIEDLKHGD